MPGFSGDNCLRVDPCPLACSGHGVCSHALATGAACVCAPGWQGPACAEPTPPTKRSVTPCAADCSGRGVCVDAPSGVATCLCAEGFEGPMCERENVCPNDCSLHGVCKRRKCECAPGYTGRSCGTQLPPPPDGRLAAAEPERACPNRCWGRGACVADPATGAGKCACDPGFVGSDCSQVEACPDDCGGRGLCQYGACFCDPGWEGANCSSAAGCPHGCSAHGECRHGLCYCEPGYDGAGCEIAPPPSTRAEIAPHALAALCAMVFVAATLGGLALKVVSDQRRRARLIRYIQESDAQAPFVSGELKRAVGAP